MFHHHKARRIFFPLLILLLSIVVYLVSNQDSIETVMARNSYKSFLPFVMKPGARQVMVGVYTDGYLGEQSSIDNEVKTIDAWSGKRNSIVGTFIAIEDQYPFYNIPVPLGKIWDSGYTPFVNLETAKTLRDINAGNMDSQIRAMASAFKTWHDDGVKKGQNRKAFVAPLQEMNGYWVNYHGSAGDFKAAYQRIKNIFNEEGASSAVRWVFAPNGWSDPSDPPFEDYYPGDNEVEVIAMSGYNAGYCPTASYKTWDTPDKTFGPYIERMQRMAPSKPIFIAQTGTSAYTQNGYSVQAKNQWLNDAYKYLANLNNVAGVIYFNKAQNQTCDWTFYKSNGDKFEGYKQGISGSEYIYISPDKLTDMDVPH